MIDNIETNTDIQTNTKIQTNIADIKIEDNSYINLPHLKNLDYFTYKNVMHRQKGLMTFMIGDRCNLRCLYCFTGAGDETRTLAHKYSQNTNIKLPKLCETDYKNLIDMAYNADIHNIILCSDGENTLYVELLKNTIDYAYEKNIHLVMFTNGVLIDNKLAKYLYNHEVGLIAKINSLNPELNNAITQSFRWQYKYSDLNTQKVPDYLHRLLNAGYDAQTLAVNMVIHGLNFTEVGEFWHWARDANTGITPFGEFLDLTGFVNNHPQLILNVGEIAKIKNDVQTIDEKCGIIYDHLPQSARLLDIRFLTNPYTVVIDSQGFVKDHAAVFNPKEIFGVYGAINMQEMFVKDRNN